MTNKDDIPWNKIHLRRRPFDGCVQRINGTFRYYEGHLPESQISGRSNRHIERSVARAREKWRSKVGTEKQEKLLQIELMANFITEDIVTICLFI